MKKIPTLFERIYEGNKIVDIKPNVTPGMEWVLQGEGVATIKIDGACCAFIDGEFYKRYDCKEGRKPPNGFIPCCEPDKITGHWPGWIKCDRNNPADKWFWKAYDNCSMYASMGPPKVQIPPIKGDELYSDLQKIPVTLEAYGLHFNGNPYHLSEDGLIFHGQIEVEVERTFDRIKKYLSESYVEGLVFWKDGQAQCKIKRSDFGLPWGNK